MTPGIYQMTNEDYQADPALSKGGLVEFSRSPAHYQAFTSEKREPTPAMLFGSQFHCAALEPDLFKKRYVVQPNVDRRTKAGKDEWTAFEQSVKDNGQMVITQDNLDLCYWMCDSLFSSEIAKSLLSGGQTEQSIFWQHPKWQFTCKCRPDCLNKEHHIVVDLKTTTDASHDAFSRAVVNYRYHWQSAWYLDGIQEIVSPDYHEFIFIVIEKSPPFAVQIYRISHHDIYLAQEQIKPLLSRYAECLAADRWPGPPDRIQMLELPQWYMNHALD